MELEPVTAGPNQDRLISDVLGFISQEGRDLLPKYRDERAAEEKFDTGRGGLATVLEPLLVTINSGLPLRGRCRTCENLPGVENSQA